MIVSFFDAFAGLCGFLSVLLASLVADILGYDRYKIEKGYYGFNSLLVGLGIGLNLQAGWLVLLFVLLASFITLLLTVTLENTLGKNLLPYLSLPFLIPFWFMLLAMRELHFLNLSEQGVLFLNEIFVFGGYRLISIYEWWNNFEILTSLRIYLISLGAIFFQYKVISGILIALALLYYSRIAFSLSLIGFYCAYFFYQLMGADFTEIGFSYIGFNFILTAIAIGGYFLVPSRASYFLAIVLTPITVLFTLSLSQMFSVWHIYIYSLPFNIVVLLFLYAYRLRVNKPGKSLEVEIQRNSPELNLYMYLNSNHRFKDYSLYPIRLPFYGEWKVSQGHDGEYTHKSKWRYAWDFVITDTDGKTYRDLGANVEDYYCYNKAVLSPYDGYVDEVIDGIPDNPILDVNIEENWGNTIVIRHGENFYSKISHLKPGSFKVMKGEWVRAGQLIAFCGNSGRSPEPHIHLQLQKVPFVDGVTVDYPVSQYVKKVEKGYEYNSYSFPKEGETVSNIEINSLMKKAFHLIPGDKISFDVEKKGKVKRVEWEVYTNIYNYSYIYCRTSNSVAYFVDDGKTFYFYNFVGSKRSLLYYFFIAAYKVPLGFYKDVAIKDTFALHFVYSKPGLFLQDFIAPFFVFLKSNYELKYDMIDEVINPSYLTLNSSAEKLFLGKITGKKSFSIEINKEGIETIKIFLKKKTIKATCIREL
jgi:urea transporter/murein DD-endopeptidase MepM/ murein hydrolase activator NlpD